MRSIPPIYVFIQTTNDEEEEKSKNENKVK
jgi:hypothetical protein